MPGVAELQGKVDCSGNFGDLSELLRLQDMSSSAAVPFEFLPVQNAAEASRTFVNGSTSSEFGPGKHQSKTRYLSRIKPQMMQKVLSSIRLSDKTADFDHVNHQAKGFNERSDVSSHPEVMELFPVSAGFGSNPRVTEKNIIFPCAIGQTDSVSSTSIPVKAPEQQSTNQLAVFYNGMVNVYDVPLEKVEAIMKLAGVNQSNETITSKTSSSRWEHILKPLPSKPTLNAVNENQLQRLPIGLEFVRKLSVQRFLQKRKERIKSVAPYTTMNSATLPGKNSDDQIFLSLACPSLQQFEPVG